MPVAVTSSDGLRRNESYGPSSHIFAQNRRYLRTGDGDSGIGDATDHFLARCPEWSRMLVRAAAKLCRLLKSAF
jgi:hypothetical protein